MFARFGTFPLHRCYATLTRDRPSSSPTDVLDSFFKKSKAARLAEQAAQEAKQQAKRAELQEEQEAASAFMQLIRPTSLAPPSQDPLLGYFARLIMRDGKLLTAQGHVTTMLNHIRLLTNDHPLPLFRDAVAQASPSVRVVAKQLTKTKRVDLPLPLSEKQRVRNGLLAIVKHSDKRIKSETVFGKRLAAEVLSVLDGSSQALVDKQLLHKKAMLARSNVRVPRA